MVYGPALNNPTVNIVDFASRLHPYPHLVWCQMKQLWISGTDTPECLLMNRKFASQSLHANFVYKKRWSELSTGKPTKLAKINHLTSSQKSQKVAIMINNMILIFYKIIFREVLNWKKSVNCIFYFLVLLLLLDFATERLICLCFFCLVLFLVEYLCWDPMP